MGIFFGAASRSRLLSKRFSWLLPGDVLRDVFAVVFVAFFHLGMRFGNHFFEFGRKRFIGFCAVGFQKVVKRAFWQIVWPTFRIICGVHLVRRGKGTRIVWRVPIRRSKRRNAKRKCE